MRPERLARHQHRPVAVIGAAIEQRVVDVGGVLKQQIEFVFIRERAIEQLAPSFGLRLETAGVRDAVEIERAISAIAQEPNGALIVLPNPVAILHRALTIALAAKLHLPAVYPHTLFVKSGGLLSYGVDLVEMYRQSASYVDRIFKGEKPADMPVQAPTKYELVINLKTAKALGLEVPPSLLASADEVIE